MLNRGARRMALFESPGDYVMFLSLLKSALARSTVRCLSYCLMPNHFHLVLWPRKDGDLSKCMFWLTTAHAMAWQAARGTRGLGHVYQGRFKAFPVCEDEHYLRVCRYVEQNPLRANLVTRAQDWQWSSLFQRATGAGLIPLEAWPVDRPDQWVEVVNEARPAEVDSIRLAVKRSAPYGPKDWRDVVAPRLGIERSIAPIGRPRNTTAQTDLASL